MGGAYHEKGKCLPDTIAHMRAHMYMYVRVGDVRNRSILEVSHVNIYISTVSL